MKALRVPRTADFTSRLRGPQVSARVGMWLGVAFAVAFVTGVFSHYAQADPAPAWLATRPVWLYRVTQGVHVLAGTAAIPLLLVKLWSVYPRLFIRPPALRRWRAALVHLLERGSIAVLVASALFQVVTGVVNTTTWYPWSFSFRSAHYAVAWIAVGSLLVHVAVKLPVIRSALGADVDAAEARTSSPPGEKDAAVSRRTVLRATWLAAGVAVLSTAGATIPGLRRVSVFAVRSGEGPQGIPINGSAVEAGVTASARSPAWRLELVNGARHGFVSRAELEAMPQHEARLPIACVEGWSASGTWSGVRVRDVLARVGAPPNSRLRVFSLQEGWEEDLPPQYAADGLTLLALRLGGEPLALDHGYPCRLIAPNRPGVTQTKWLRRLEVVT
ncbi:MAG: molybdopterin-dependent oxidoreductase [Actinomycetota bacterium]|nr:molybdopterin-dependent oxidoreductase [Actinomycetota bacterium]